MRIADLHPDLVYEAGRRHAAEQYAAATARPIPTTQSTSGLPAIGRSEQSEFRRGARKFAEAHPEIVNHYANCDGSCRSSAMRDVVNIPGPRWEGQNTYLPPGGYRGPPYQHHVPTASPHHDNHLDAPRGLEYGPGLFCEKCQNCSPSHNMARGSGVYGDLILMGVPGRDCLIHHESCVQAQPYCRCQDCEARRTGRFGSPDGSYVRERAREWVREV
jgi:hypothetical protein